MTDKTEKLDKPQHKPRHAKTSAEALATDGETVVLREAVEKVGKAGDKVTLARPDAQKLRHSGKARRLRLDDIAEAK